MKSKFFILGCTALMVAGIFYSCRKDNTAPTDPDSYQDAQIVETPDINNLLLHFNQEFENFKSGKLLKSGVKIDKDSVIWYIDAAINFNYASGVYSFERLHRDTVYVEVQLDSDMKALLADVFESYDKAQIRVGSKFYATTGENKKFVMATVSDAGSIAGGKRKLSIATLMGTGKATISEDFGNDESYLYNADAEINCAGLPALGAPVIFDAMLLEHFNPEPTNGSRYYFVGTPTILEYRFENFKIGGAPPTNYLDYKIYAAYENLEFTDSTLCLEYNQRNSGIHEMQFYYDHLIELAQSNVPYRKSFAFSEIESPTDGLHPDRVFYHLPKFYFKLKVTTYEHSNPVFPID